MPEDNATNGEYKTLLLDRFQRIEKALEKNLSVQMQTREDLATIKQEVRDLHRSQDALQTRQGELEDAMSELSKAMTTLAGNVNHIQNTCDGRRNFNERINTQLNDPKDGLSAKYLRIDEKIAFASKLWWIAIAASIAALFDLVKRKFGG